MKNIFDGKPKDNENLKFLWEFQVGLHDKTQGEICFSTDADIQYQIVEIPEIW